MAVSHHDATLISGPVVTTPLQISVVDTSIRVDGMWITVSTQRPPVGVALDDASGRAYAGASSRCWLGT